MKKQIGILTGGISALLFANSAYAQKIEVCPRIQDFNFLCQLNAGNAVSSLVTLAVIIGILLALAFLIYGGIRWITSQGDKAAVEAARSTIVAAIIGLVLIFLSVFILNLVGQLFFGKPLTDLLNLPSGGIFKP